MPFKYRVITANCGNDTIGIEASQQIAALGDADFLVINCQEVAIGKTLRQLQAAMSSNYKVICTGQMATHTKLATQFHSSTGIATFVIHKIDLDVAIQASQSVRRNPSRLGGGSGYNKGGLINALVMTKNKGKGTEETIKVETVSGHLESLQPKKRSIDWHNINHAIAKEDVDNWAQLVAACPHLRLSGYDANTRNKFNDRGRAVNLWKSPYTPEMQALYQAPLAGQHFSTTSTYQTKLDNIATVPDKRRLGYARGGMLDFVGVADGSEVSVKISRKGVTQIPAEKSTQRDHNVIISPLKEYTIVSEFSVVKGQLATRLARVAPSLAQNIRDLDEDHSDLHKETLLKVYQLFLKPKGFLNTMIVMHVEKLACLERLHAVVFLKDNAVKRKISATLFSESPWFESCNLANLDEVAKKHVQKMHLMQQLITSLNGCETESGFENRLKLYNDLTKTIENKSYNAQVAIDTFKKWPIDEYLSFLNRLKDALDNYQPTTLNQQIFKQQGRDVLVQMTLLAPDASSAKMLNSKRLSQLSRVAEQSRYVVEAVNDQKKDLRPIIKQLTVLSQEVSGKSSTGWKALGSSLLAFACIALVVAGVLAAIPSGGASLLFTVSGAVGLTGLSVGATAGVVGAGMFLQGKEKGLAKSILAYNTAITDLTKDKDATNDDSRTSSETHSQSNDRAKP